MLNFKHTIILVCYNQEKYIEDTMDSIFNRNELPYEVLIYDDCSKDNTLSILKKYAQKYPDILKLNSNSQNLGLYKNVQQASLIYNGDIIHFVAGDDLVGDGLIKEIDDEVSILGLDPQITNFICMPKIKLFSSDDGEELISTSKKLIDCFPLDYLAATKRLYWQQKGISSSMMRLWGDYSIGNKEVGIYSDYIHNIIFFANSPYVVNIPKNYDVHRIGSGVTSNNFEDIFLSFFRACKYIIESNFENKYSLSFLCNSYIQYEYIRGCYIADKSFYNGIKFLLYSIKVIFNDFGMSKTVLFNFYSTFKFK